MGIPLYNILAVRRVFGRDRYATTPIDFMNEKNHSLEPHYRRPHHGPKSRRGLQAHIHFHRTDQFPIDSERLGLLQRRRQR
jgi:hypothetical protein